MSKVRKGKSLIIFLFLLFCLCLLNAIPAGTQLYPPFQLSQNFSNLSWNQPASMPFSSFYYPYGQNWNQNISNSYPQFGIFPSVYQSGSSQTTQWLEGEIIVHFTEDVVIEDHGGGPTTNKSAINELIQQYGISAMEYSSSGGFYIVKFSKSHDVDDVQKAFENLGDHVTSAEPHLVRRAHSSSSMSMGNWGFPQSASIYTPLSYSLFGTGISSGSQYSPYQASPSNLSWFQGSSSPNYYSIGWQNPSFSSLLQSSYNPWQQLGWGTTQTNFNPIYNLWY